MSRETIVRGCTLLLALLVGGYALSDDSFYGGEPGFGRTQQAILALGLALCALLPVRVTARVLLASVTGLVALAAAELVGERLLAPRLRPIYQADDRLIFKFLPDRTSATRRPPINGGERIVHRINRDGFRGAELAPAGASTPGASTGTTSSPGIGWSPTPTRTSTAPTSACFPAASRPATR